MFSSEFTKFLRTPFLQNTSRRLLLFLAFLEAATGGILWKKVFLKISQNSQKKLLAYEIFKNTFFTEHLWTTASAFSFSEAAIGGVLWKGCSWKFSKIQWKHLRFAKFSKTPFLQNNSGRLLPTFSCNVTKMRYCQQCLGKLRWIFVI